MKLVHAKTLSQGYPITLKDNIVSVDYLEIDKYVGIGYKGNFGITQKEVLEVLPIQSRGEDFILPIVFEDSSITYYKGDTLGTLINAVVDYDEWLEKVLVTN